MGCSLGVLSSVAQMPGPTGQGQIDRGGVVPLLAAEQLVGADSQPADPKPHGCGAVGAGRCDRSMHLSERAWGTVHSANGAAWDDFPHDQARSMAHRWGEDGMAGVSGVGQEQQSR